MDLVLREHQRQTNHKFESLREYMLCEASLSAELQSYTLFVVSLCCQSQAKLYHQTTQHFWAGHFDRCIYFASKYSPQMVAQIKTTMVQFMYGISACHSKYKMSNKGMKKVAVSCLEALREAANESKWNFNNKFLLLEAEIHSLNCRSQKANSSFAAAILASRSSRFIHEEGLCCEMAGLHYKKHKELESANKMFRQAKGEIYYLQLLLYTFRCTLTCLSLQRMLPNVGKSAKSSSNECSNSIDQDGGRGRRLVFER